MVRGLELSGCRIWGSPGARFGLSSLQGSALSLRADLGAPRHPDSSHPMAAHGAGSCWQDPLAVEGTTCRPVCGTRCGRALSAVFVPSCRSAPCPALRSLRAACRQLRGRLRTVPFGRLALGDTAALDLFYNAGEEEKTPRPVGASVSPLGAVLGAVLLRMG